MRETFDEAMMRRALQLAAAAAQAEETPVGAVLADQQAQRVIAECHNQPITLCDPTGHAEILALRAGAAVMGNYRLTGLSLYVTLEPCAMCAGAIAHARIGRLVFSAEDPKGGAVVHGGKFFSQPTCHWRPEVVSGLFREESADLLRGFFRERRGKTGSRGRPPT